MTVKSRKRKQRRMANALWGVIELYVISTNRRVLENKRWRNVRKAWKIDAKAKRRKRETLRKMERERKQEMVYVVSRDKKERLKQ